MEIEKGIPVPKDGRIKYPFSEMAVGDSFVIGLSERSRLGNAIRYSSKEKGTKYVARKVGPDELRCWRIK